MDGCSLDLHGRVRAAFEAGARLLAVSDRFPRRCARERRLLLALVLAAVLGSGLAVPSAAREAPGSQAEACGPASLVADFAARDLLPQTRVAPHDWYARNWNSGWGPRAAAYPAVEAPPDCDPVAWKRARVVAVARRYLGLPYRHHHVPDWDPPAELSGPDRAGLGLDCSNFTAWVYNYGLGLQFTSHIERQANGPEAPGRVLAPDEPFAPGDLLFILQRDRTRVSHVVLYAGDGLVIDSAGGRGGVSEHVPSGWYLTHYSHARRIVE